MSGRQRTLGVLATGLVAAAVVALIVRGDPRVQSEVASATKADPRGSLAVSSVLKIRPSGGTAPPAVMHAAQASRASGSADLRQLIEGRDLAGLYRRAAGQTTPEAMYIAAAIMARCAPRTTSDARKADREKHRQAFLARVDSATQKGQKRTAAYDRLYVDACLGLEDLPAQDASAIAKMVEQAAGAGDVRAQAWNLARRIEGEFQAQQRQGQRVEGYPLNEADFRQALQLLQSGDPQVIHDLRGLLSSTIQAAELRFDQEPIDPQAMHAAWLLAGCSFGGRCGPDAPEVLAPCVHQGRCDAVSVDESVYFYDASPYQAQLIDRYRAALVTMIQTNDWSRLTYVPRTGNTGNSWIFGARRGF